MVDITNTLGGVSTTSQTSGTTPKKELDQASFLKLLTMQLSYQDPFKPVDNAQTLSQMTSMSTSDAINRLSTQMGSLNDLMTSSQALQASSLVGQSVLIPSDTGYLDTDGQVSGVAAVGGQKLSNLKITVEDEKGQVIKEAGQRAVHLGWYRQGWQACSRRQIQVQSQWYRCQWQIGEHTCTDLRSGRECDLGELSFSHPGSAQRAWVYHADGYPGDLRHQEQT